MLSDKSSKRSHLGVNLGVMILTLLICLIGGEVFLRIYGYKPKQKVSNFNTYDDTLGWKGVPRFRTVIDGIVYSMNSWGFRDDEHTKTELSPTRSKVMFLGDSYVFGLELPRDDRVSELLEKSDSIVSYNFGISGYSTDQELLVLKEYGPMVEPNYVLLFLCGNDLIFNNSPREKSENKPLFQRLKDDSLTLTNVPVPRSLVGPPPLVKWLSENFALGLVVQRVWSHFNFNREWEKLEATAEKMHIPNKGSDRDSLLMYTNQLDIGDLTYYLLRDMRDECNRLNASLILFVVPSSMSWTTKRDDTPIPLVRVMQWSSALGIKAVDLFPVFRKDYLQNGQDLYLMSDRAHWNARGNQVAAEAVRQVIHHPVENSNFH